MILYKNFLTYLSPLILSIGIIGGCFHYHKLNVVCKTLFFYLIASLTIDISARLLANSSDNNLILWIFLSAIELLSFTLIYYHFLTRHKWLAKFFFALGLIFIFYEITTIDFDQSNTFQSYAKVVSSFIVSILVLFYFFNYLNKTANLQWSKVRIHLIIFFYFTLNVILLLPINFLINQASGITIYIWYLYLTTTLAFYTYITLFIWKNGKIQIP